MSDQILFQKLIISHFIILLKSNDCYCTKILVSFIPFYFDDVCSVSPINAHHSSRILIGQCRPATKVDQGRYCRFTTTLAKCGRLINTFYSSSILTLHCLIIVTFVAKSHRSISTSNYCVYVSKVYLWTL